MTTIDYLHMKHQPKALPKSQYNTPSGTQVVSFRTIENRTVECDPCRTQKDQRRPTTKNTLRRTPSSGLLRGPGNGLLNTAPGFARVVGVHCDMGGFVICMDYGESMVA